MKLFYIVNARIPTEKAHGIQIMKMCEAFADLGHDVELIVPNRKNIIKKDLFNFYNVRRNFKVTKTFTIDLFGLGHFYWISFWIQLVTFFISAKILLTFKNKQGALIYGRDIYAPLIFGEMFLELHTLPKSLGFMLKRALSGCKTTFVLTSLIKNKLVLAGVPYNKVVVLPDAVDLSEFSIPATKEDCRKKLGLSLSDRLVVYTGHLYDWKGAGVLADAAQLLTDDVKIIFVGGTELDIAVFKKKYQHSKNIIITGHKEHKDIPLWLGCADVLVLPNSGKEDISRLYTSPMKLFEYMASGRPRRLPCRNL